MVLIRIALCGRTNAGEIHHYINSTSKMPSGVIKNTVLEHIKCFLFFFNLRRAFRVVCFSATAA